MKKKETACSNSENLNTVQETSSKKDPQSRKFQLTINNPKDSGQTHEQIKNALHSIKALVYYCMADEKAATPHTHVFVAFSSPVRCSTIKRKFPKAHIEIVVGTCAENRAYIEKSGKWETDLKHGSKIEGTFEEWGTMPEERQARRNDYDDILEMMESGATNLEILYAHPKVMWRLDRLDLIRQTIHADRYTREAREVKVTYVCGGNQCEQLSALLALYDYKPYRVTDYNHPFDTYGMQDTVIFDSFHGQIPIDEMMHFLDGEPLSLPCRYTNRIACYTAVYILSDVPLNRLYADIQLRKPALWDSFRSLITDIINFDPSFSFDDPASLPGFGGALNNAAADVPNFSPINSGANVNGIQTPEELSSSKDVNNKK